MMNLDTPFLKIKEAARVTGLSTYMLRRLAKDGTAPCVMSGGVYYVNVPLLLKQLGVPNDGGQAEG